MAELKGSKTEQNLKEAFAGESQANPTRPRCSARLPRVRWVMRSGTSTFSPRSATPATGEAAGPVRLALTHDAYTHAVELTDENVAELLADLRA